MRKHLSKIATVALVGAVAGCTSGNSAIEPAFTSANLNNDKLQLAVGTARFADGSVGLNTVTTFRQPNGLSATLLNTPHLSGPFTVPAAATTANTDKGTSTINGSPQVLPGQTALATTFSTTGGVFAYGFAPDNSSTSGAAVFGYYSEPRYPEADPGLTAYTYVGGAPAYPRITDGTFAAAQANGFLGYPEGFTAFVTTPVMGSYNLSVGIQDSNGNTTTISAPTATLSSTTALPAIAAPTFAKDGNGGGTISFTAPAGVTETIVNVIDRSAGVYYTIVAQGAGPQTVTLPPTIGPGSTPTASIPAGDTYRILLVGADYPLFEAAPPANTQQTPTIVGANGQADITLSPAVGGTY